jgi:SNF2 family DNA or RNA helicase
MSRLHGGWVEEHFFLWGEGWHSLDLDSLPQESEEIIAYPFSLSQDDLISLLNSNTLSQDKFVILTEEKWKKQIINLPTQKKGKSGSYKFLPLLSSQLTEDNLSQINQKSLVLHPWQVEGIVLTPQETVNFLRLLPLGDNSYQGDDLIFWGQVYRWALHLLSRYKFLPSITRKNEGMVEAKWQPLLDSAIDQSRLAKFTQLMPNICCSYQEIEQKQDLLLGFLSAIVDAQLRVYSESSNLYLSSSSLNNWLQALRHKTGIFEWELNQIKRLENALLNWTLPIQDYYLGGQHKLGQILFRPCFLLTPPTAEELDKNYGDWTLNYGLQALDDPEFIVDAAAIWQCEQQDLDVNGRTIKEAQETLLKGLGLAARIYSPVAESLKEKLPLQSILNPIEVYEFIRSIAWQLEDKGLGVIIPPSLARGAGEKQLSIKITANITQKKGERLTLKSLINYDLKLAVGEQIISRKDFEKLLQQRSPLVHINGEWIALQPAGVKAAQGVLEHSAQDMSLSVEDALRLTTGDTKTIAKLPVVAFEASGILEELLNNLTNNQGVQLLPTPADLRGELRPYQTKGFSWLAFLERWGLGACLADDMGLGKTLQLITFLLHLKAEGVLAKPCLVICPTSVLSNWEREVKKFAPSLSTLVHHGEKRSRGKDFIKEITKKDLVITSYSLVYRDEKNFEGIEWQTVVLDEAQNIKNPSAKQSQAVKKLKTNFPVALTGTPVENRLTELWSILDFLNPGFLGNRQFFQRRFAIPIEKYGDKESLQSMRTLVQPFILRRLKTDKDIIQDLPEKQEMNVFCGLSLEQGQLYQQLIDSSLEEIESAEGIKRRGLILTLLLRLKQICNHPAQFLKREQIQSSESSGKLLRLEEMLDELVAEGDRALIFTQFAEWGKLLKPYLEQKLGVETLFLSGSSSRQQRQEMIDRFQNDPQGPPLFILSLKAGGTGLNLTRANHVFHFDRWWNPAIENQATDRAFRIGQKRNVQVHKFVCTGTLEERINEMIESKKQLAEQTIDVGENWLTELDTEQLRNLLLLDRNAIIDEE